MNRAVTTIITLMLLLVASGIVHADIYIYMDSRGVMHFTDSPKNPDYQVYIREKKRRSKSVRKAPSHYDAYIHAASSKYNISVSLLKAVIMVESNFNPRAVSKAGAKGLMQVMPINYALCNISDPFDPYENIMGGTFYLRKMLDRFDGRVPLALAAYNAGPSKVAQYQEIPPYPETKKYVKKVLNYYSSYRKM